MTEAPDQNVFIEDDILREGFTIMPNIVLHMKGLSLQAKAIYGIIYQFSHNKDHCFPGMKTLSEITDLSEKMLKHYIDELKQIGLIEVKQRGLGKTNLYVFKKLVKCADPKQVSDQDPKQVSVDEESKVLRKKEIKESNQITFNENRLNKTEKDDFDLIEKKLIAWKISDCKKIIAEHDKIKLSQAVKETEEDLNLNRCKGNDIKQPARIRGILLFKIKNIKDMNKISDEEKAELEKIKARKEKELIETERRLKEQEELKNRITDQEREQVLKEIEEFKRQSRGLMNEAV